MSERARSVRLLPVRRPVLTTVAALALAALSYVMAIALGNTLFTVRSEVLPADVIVVLGGDGPPRAARAAALWREGLAPRVVVAGDGDCTYIRDAMIERGVAPAAIAMDCLSRNTWENALKSAPYVEAFGSRTAILVTSWYHSRRALETFRRICPGLDWVSVPAEPPPFLAVASGRYGVAIAVEYAKIAVYRLRAALLPQGEIRPGAACVGP